MRRIVLIVAGVICVGFVAAVLFQVLGIWSYREWQHKRTLRKRIDADPYDASALTELANMSYKDPRKAVDYYKRAILVDASLGKGSTIGLDPWYGLGMSYLMLGTPGSTAPDDHETMLKCAEVLRKRGKVDVEEGRFLLHSGFARLRVAGALYVSLGSKDQGIAAWIDGLDGAMESLQRKEGPASDVLGLANEIREFRRALLSIDGLDKEASLRVDAALKQADLFLSRVPFTPDDGGTIR